MKTLNTALVIFDVLLLSQTQATSTDGVLLDQFDTLDSQTLASIFSNFIDHSYAQRGG